MFRIDTFANPEALLLLLLLPIYLFWYVRYYKKQRLVIRMSYDPTKLSKPGINLAFLRVLPRILQTLGLALIIVAIARPQSGRDITQRTEEGTDIVLILDTSGSMETEDFNPSRLEVAKETAANFINGRENDRIGLVLFAANALSYSPLTQDYDYLNRMIKSVRFDMVSKQGTAIGSAMAAAINRLRDSESSSRVIVLITDGANNSGEIDPITAARLANEFNIRTYCIGIGKKTYSRPGSSKVLDAELDEPTLERIASITNGKFFRVTDANGLESVFKEISAMEQSEIQEIQLREVSDHYHTFVKIAIILLGISFLLMLTFVYNPLEQ